MSQVQRGVWECKFGSFQQKRVLEPMRQDSNAKELIQVKNEKVQGLSPEQQRLQQQVGVVGEPLEDAEALLQLMVR